MLFKLPKYRWFLPLGIIIEKFLWKKFNTELLFLEISTLILTKLGVHKYYNGMMWEPFNRKEIISIKNIRSFLDSFAKDDNWHNLDAKTGNLGYGWIHYSLIRVFRPTQVLVIGSRWGFVPAVCALACKDNQKGMVDFVDAGYDYQNPKDKKHWGGVGYWKEKDPKKHFNKFNLENYIHIYITTSKEFSKKYPKKKWDYINIDADHSYEGISSDFETFWPRLRKRGFMSLHDIYTNLPGSLEYGVYRYWAKIKKIYPNTLEFAGEYGLGLLQKE